MDAKQTALRLVLDELHEDHDITSVAERVRIQKAVYIAQIMGVNLGYSYSWYVRGPYSTSLTRDYYALEEAAGNAEPNPAIGKTLHPSLRQRLEKVRALLAKPNDVGLEKWQWYELLASMHFLMAASNYGYEKACEILRSTKPHLNAYLEIGYDHLRRASLVA